jgi:hypothetical protein
VGVAAGAGLLASVLAASPAAAHTVAGVAPTNYLSQIVDVSPQVAGLHVRLYDLGRRVRLTNLTDVDVIVIGYSGEPYLRVGPRGVEENRRSPTLYENTVTAIGLPPPLPPSASATAPLQWHRRSGSRTVSWPDRRAYWSGPPSAGVATSPGSRQIVVPTWTIPMQAGALSVHVVGRIVWVPGSSPWPWLGLAFLLTAGIVALAFTGWWEPALRAGVAFLIAVDVVHTWGIAAAPGGRLGSEVLRLLTAGTVSVVGWIVGALAIDLLQRRRDVGLLAAAIMAAEIALFGGIGDAATLVHSQVPVDFPVVVARVAVALSLGLGLGLVAAAVLRLRRFPISQPTPGSAAP